MNRNVVRPVIIFLAASMVMLLTGSFATKIKPETKKIRVVCIDAGHGGKDPGCHGDFAKEKDVALAVALKFGKYISDHYPDVKVVYTRTTDVFVELNERAAIANRNNADIFICIHCNSACVRKKDAHGKYHDLCNEEANGSETYVMGLHKAEGNLDVAKRENDVVTMEDNYQNKYNLDINSDEAEIIYSWYQNIYLEQSMRFAQLCQQQFSTNAGREDKGVKQAGFLVLWKTSMPSVLIETGFLSSPQEERFLSGEKGQDYMAASIFRAFRSWKDDVEGNNITYDDDIANMKPYRILPEDTAGLRKPFNYVTGGVSPAKNDSVKKNEDSIVQDVPIVVDSEKIKRDNAKAIYRVQLFSTDKLLADDAAEFKGSQDVWHYEQNGIYKYTSGEYYSMAEATKEQTIIRQNFPQAFIVAFDKSGNRITTDQAKKLNGR
ncbi:MAG: N-acetylmuramoyl-L-alanine amidase [Bacteroidetes bacterium]|nr:N-acetylmuramoyl-L-alanine amidase [Bacteroidota bacterium]